jgi:hypothetical protein
MAEIPNGGETKDIAEIANIKEYQMFNEIDEVEIRILATLRKPQWRNALQDLLNTH